MVQSSLSTPLTTYIISTLVLFILYYHYFKYVCFLQETMNYLGIEVIIFFVGTEPSSV